MSADWTSLAPFVVQGEPPLYIDRRAMADPDNAEPYEYEGRLYWIEKTAWSSGPVGQFTVTAEGRENVAGAEDLVLGIRTLVAKARQLVELMDDAERNHGSLIGGKTLTAVNELRLELSKWQR